MKKISIALVSILFVGCYTKRPIASAISTPDSNSRVTVEKAAYIKKKNAVGFTVSIGLVGAGAYAGYLLEPTKTQNGNEQKPLHTINASMGALTGAGLVLLSDLIFKTNTKYEVKDLDKWISKVNKNYIYLDGSYSNFRMYSSFSEEDFTINNLNDLYDFKKAFPDSKLASKKIRSYIPYLTRKEVLNVLELYPNDESVAELKIAYVEKSKLIDEVIEGRRRFPDIPLDFEALAFPKINSTIDAITFHKAFPSSKRDYELKAYEKVKNINDVYLFFADFPESQYVTKVFLKGYNEFLSGTKRMELFRRTPTTVNAEAVELTQIEYLNLFNTVDDIRSAYELLATCENNQLTTFDAIDIIIHKNLLTEGLSDLYKLREYFGYVEKAIDKAVLDIISKDVIPIVNLYKIKEIYPELKEDTAKYITKLYNDYQNKFFAEAETDDTMWDFITTYRYRPHSEDLMKKMWIKYENERAKLALASESVSYLEDYILFFSERSHNKALMDKIKFRRIYLEVVQHGDVRDYALFGRKYPAYHKEMEERAVGYIGPVGNDLKACNDFLELFKQSKHRIDIERRRQEAMTHGATMQLISATERQTSIVERQTERLINQTSTLIHQGTKCNSCTGHGKCHTCKGKGYDDYYEKCRTCNGFGVCQSCKGSGRNN